MRSSTRTMLLAAALGFAPSAARGWWNAGHQYVTDGAIQHLPEPFATFFRAHEAFIVTSSGAEPPGTHYLDIDAYPEFDPTDPASVARDLDTLIAIHGESTVSGNGTAPWTTAEYVATLSAQIAAATTPNDWLALRTVAAELAHYVGDLHNPLHLTLNFNGQLTGNFGIHARYEGEMLARYLDEIAIVPAPAHCVYLPSTLDTIFDGIYDHYPFVADIITADTTHRGSPPNYDDAYYTAMWADTGAFTTDLLQEASEVLASAWYTAWVDAGSPVPVFPIGMGDADGDGDIDLLDYATLQACAATTDGQPLTPLCAPLDFDASGTVNNADIPAFLTVLQGP